MGSDHGSGSLREERLGWIFGSSRSGSTWLREMLGDIGRVATIDDPHIGHHLGVWRPIPLAWAAAEEVPELSTLDEIKAEKPGYFFSERYAHVWRPALRELIATRFAAEAADQVGRDPAATVVKEPGSQVAGLLLSLFPRSKLIFLLRDGRDVVDSWIDAYQRGSWALEEGAFAVAPEGRLALVRWQASVWAYRTAAVRAAYDRHDPDSRVLVRYEHLLADPVGQLERICAALGLEVRREWLRAISERRRFARLPSGRRGRRKQQRAADPGNWRRNLTAAEQRAMLEILGDELQAAGYTTDEPPTVHRPRAA